MASVVTPYTGIALTKAKIANKLVVVIFNGHFSDFMLFEGLQHIFLVYTTQPIADVNQMKWRWLNYMRLPEQRVDTRP